MKHSVPTRLPALDLLRFLAASAVMVYHYTYNGPVLQHWFAGAFASIAPVTRYGWLGVELFFLISGYVVLLSARHKTPRQFVLARVIRLYPAYWLVCLLTVVQTEDFSWPVKLCNFTMLQQLLGQPSINGAFWTLTVELSFYFLISLLLAYKAWNQLPLLLALWLAYCAWAGPVGLPTAFNLLLFPRYAPYFASGMLFYLLQHQAFSARKLWPLVGAALLLALRGTNETRLELQHTYAGEPAFSPLVMVGIVLGFYLLLLLIVYRRLSLSRFPWVQQLGELTYPLYLVHLLGYGIFRFFRNSAHQWLLLSGVCGLMLLLAWAIHRFVERPVAACLWRRLNANQKQ